MSFVPGTHFYRQKTKYTKPARHQRQILQLPTLVRTDEKWEKTKIIPDAKMTELAGD